MKTCHLGFKEARGRNAIALALRSKQWTDFKTNGDFMKLYQFLFDWDDIEYSVLCHGK